MKSPDYTGDCLSQGFCSSLIGGFSAHVFVARDVVYPPEQCDYNYRHGPSNLMIGSSREW